MLTLTLAIPIFVPTVLSATPLPRLGPAYLQPSDLTSNKSLVRQAWLDLGSKLDFSILHNSSFSGLGNLDSYTFSISAFSLNDPSAAHLLQYHHTGSNVRESSYGTKMVDDSSIYRLGSISKLFTVYTTLMTIGTEYWDQPITNYVSDLSGSHGCQASSARQESWCQVTLGALAGQMGGILRNVAASDNDLTVALSAQGINPSSFGFPSLESVNSSNLLACLQYQLTTNSESCPTGTYLESIVQRAPVYPSWTSPSYSNAGFDLLALAVENITGRQFRDLVKQNIFDPLNMSSSFYIPPADLNRAVIPGNSNSSSIAFTSDYGEETPSGGMFSTLSDMSKFGLSILGSSLLDSRATAEWLKPVTHTGSLRVSVGRPWEIYRLDVDNRTIDLYTKSGGINDYGTYFILSPDHGAGFTILGAADSGISTFIAIVTQYLAINMVTALERQAAQEAGANFAGRYVATNMSMNASLTLSVDAAQGPGLHVTSWIVEEIDFLHKILPVVAGADSISLLPAMLETLLPNNGKEIAFRASYASSSLNTSTLGPLLQPINGAWSSLDRPLYGGIPLDLFLLTVDSSGNATKLEVPALNMLLARTV